MATHQPHSVSEALRDSLFLVSRPRYFTILTILASFVQILLVSIRDRNIFPKLLAKQEVEVSPQLLILTLAVFVPIPPVWIFITHLQASFFAKRYLNPESKLSISRAPKPWKNILVMYFWSSLVTLVNIVTKVPLIVQFVLVVREFSRGNLMFAGLLLAVLSFSMIGSVLLQVVLDLATAICVWEYRTGIQALKRGVLLLSGNWYKGCQLFLLLDMFVILMFTSMFMPLMPLMNLAINGVLIIILLFAYTFHSLLRSSGRVVFYFSCRAYHQEQVEQEYMLIDHLDLGNDLELGKEAPSAKLTDTQ